MASEIIWAASPPILILGAAGFIYAFATHKKAAAWLLSLFAPFFVLYFFLHVHSYYLLGFIPFIALAASLPFGDAKTAVRWAPLIILIASFSFLQTACSLASIKWDKTQFREMSADMKGGEQSAIVLSPDVSGSYFSLFYYYMPGAQVYYRDVMKRDADGYAMIPPDRHVYIVDFFHSWIKGRPASKSLRSRGA